MLSAEHEDPLLVSWQRLTVSCKPDSEASYLGRNRWLLNPTEQPTLMSRKPGMHVNPELTGCSGSQHDLGPAFGGASFAVDGET